MWLQLNKSSTSCFQPFREKGIFSCEVASMAIIRFVLLAMILCSVFSSYNNNGVEGGSQLSQEEHDELEKQLKLLNKPAIKTIQTGHGDIYDCVDFYKQPAFDHPLLKNHTFHFQMRPYSVPKVMRQEERSTADANILKVGLKRLGCPIGTVPIKRVTKNDLIRAKLHSNTYGLKNDSKFGVLTLENPGTHYAMVRTEFDLSRRYNGGGTSMSIYNPKVQPTQSSSSRMRIQNGVDSIQVGWTVNPTLYGSNRVRLYTYLKTSKSQCFNTQCPGFVIVNTDIPLDTVIPISERGVPPIYVLDVLIFRDQFSGNWWLAVEENYTIIGFWPQSIFTDLKDLAHELEWGGEVSGPPYIPSPPMGSSNFPEKKEALYDAFCRNITIINEAREVMDARITEAYKDLEYYYEVKDVGFIEGRVRREIFFGGPGGYTGN